MQEKLSYIYILFNKPNGVLYTGVTTDLPKRVAQHKSRQVDGFSKKYNTDKLAYYEMFDDVNDAIAREKQIKAGSRAQKLYMINKLNPNREDLYEKII